ncbi:hypothetical protein BASA81_002682 [Batrachochytrium salamandrivorans]|nr:hypothetical protein BASA81_002682 [Batrachochytrium salamandrivorans]
MRSLATPPAEHGSPLPTTASSLQPASGGEPLPGFLASLLFAHQRDLPSPPLPPASANSSSNGSTMATTTTAAANEGDEEEEGDDSPPTSSASASGEGGDGFKTGRWTRTEHERFIQAFTAFDKDWRKVSEFVGTRSNIQCRTHAQKHFKGLAARELKSKSRASASPSSSNLSQQQYARQMPPMPQMPQFLPQFAIPGAAQPQPQQQQQMYFPVGFTPSMYYLQQQQSQTANQPPQQQQQTWQSTGFTPNPQFPLSAGGKSYGFVPSPPASTSAYAGGGPTRPSSTSATNNAKPDNDVFVGVEALLSLF